ncbi:winged helix-turn-helix transcriptional regulator [Halovulum sp. GXIMD14794]
MDSRSTCPINLAVEVLGDRWSLVILRDMIFGGQRSFGALKAHSLEGIATNILAARLNRLEAEGMLTRTPDPSHKQRQILSLTEKSIALVPVMAALGAWGRQFLPVSQELAIRAELLEQGGPELWRDFMDDLRHEHLGTPRRRDGPMVRERLQAAYEAVSAS